MKHAFLGMSLALLLAAPFMIPSPASAHFLGCSSVESGDIHWQSSTIYTSARDHANTAPRWVILRGSQAWTPRRISHRTTPRA